MCIRDRATLFWSSNILLLTGLRKSSTRVASLGVWGVDVCVDAFLVRKVRARYFVEFCTLSLFWKMLMIELPPLFIKIEPSDKIWCLLRGWQQSYFCWPTFLLLVFLGFFHTITKSASTSLLENVDLFLNCLSWYESSIFSDRIRGMKLLTCQRLAPVLVFCVESVLVSRDRRTACLLC